MTIDSIQVPRWPGRRPMNSTTPVTGAWCGTDSHSSLLAMGWPRTTSWPTRTMGLGTLPMCCDSGTVTRAGNGRRRIALVAVSLHEAGCTPRWKASPRK
jgi:hypothetical protein